MKKTIWIYPNISEEDREKMRKEWEDMVVELQKSEESYETN